MNRPSRLQHSLLHSASCCLLLAVISTHVSAQSGWNAINESSSGVQAAPTYAIVDATQFAGNDLCTIISNILSSTGYNPQNSKGVVIDARGVSNTTCAATNPWVNLLTLEAKYTFNFTNVVLLPVGTISIQTTWALPPHTHLIGQGQNSTVIVATSGLGSSDIIDMGQEETSSPCYALNNGNPTWYCPGIVIEHLSLSGNGTGSGNANGIVNCCAQELSRVNDVSITNVPTGLVLSDQFSQNSGPYTNLTMSGVKTCLSIGPAQAGNTMIDSRGVRGLQCSVISSSTAAITIDGPSNSLEDISITGLSTSTDGIYIGSHTPAQGNSLLNIRGTGTLKNLVRITSTPGVINSSTSTGNCPYPTVNNTNDVYTVCDLTILGVAAGSSVQATVQDDLTSSTIKDSTLAMYVLGEVAGTATSNVGFSRFTTATATSNTNATPWLVGTGAPSSGSSCKIGTLYSCTGTGSSCGSSCSSSNPCTFWQCKAGTSGPTWTAFQ